MANLKAARKNIQKVVAFLVTRFRPQEDVFEYLTLALENLKDDPKPAIKKAVVKEPVVEEASEEPPSAEVAAPRRTRRTRKP